MTPELEQFLATRLPFPGLAAWGVRLPDRSGQAKSLVGWIKRERIEQVLTRLALAIEGLRQQRLEPVRVCWKFEHLRVHLAQRQDGAWLSLFIQNQSSQPADPETVLSEFLDL